MAERPSHFRKSISSRNNLSRKCDYLTLDDLRSHGKAWISAGSVKMCSKRTLDTRRVILEKLEWFCVNKRRDRIDNRTVQDFLIYVREGYQEPGGRWGSGRTHPCALKPVTRATVNTFFAYVRAFSGWLVKSGYITKSLVAGLDAPGPSRDQIQPFTPAHVRAMIGACRYTTAPDRNEAIIRLLYDTGIRREETVRIKVSDIDMVHNCIRVEGKGDKARTVYFGSDTRAAIFKWIGMREGLVDHDYLFVGYRGSAPGAPMTETGIYRAVKIVAARAGITDIRCSPHTLRHGFAVEFLNLGGNSIALQTMLGHETMQMTTKYVNFSNANLEEQHRQFSPGDSLRHKRKKRKP